MITPQFVQLFVKLVQCASVCTHSHLTSVPGGIPWKTALVRTNDPAGGAVDLITSYTVLHSCILNWNKTDTFPQLTHRIANFKLYITFYDRSGENTFAHYALNSKWINVFKGLLFFLLNKKLVSKLYLYLFIILYLLMWITKFRQVLIYHLFFCCRWVMFSIFIPLVIAVSIYTL